MGPESNGTMGPESNGVTYTETLKEHLLQRVFDLRLRLCFGFQHADDLKHTAKKNTEVALGQVSVRPKPKLKTQGSVKKPEDDSSQILPIQSNKAFD